MRDAGGAGRDGKDFGQVTLRLGCRVLFGLLSLLGVTLGLAPVNGREELLRRLRRAQGVSELLVHQELRELCQHLQMHVVLSLRCGDHEGERRGCIIRCFPVNALGKRHRG